MSPDPQPETDEPHVHPDTTIPFWFTEPAPCVATEGPVKGGQRHPHACTETTTHADGKISIVERDAQGRTTRIAERQGLFTTSSESWTYDEAGRLTRHLLRGKESRESHWVYDTDGRLLEERSTGSISDGPWFWWRKRYVYEGGRLIRIDQFDSPTAQAPTSSDVYVYEAERLTRIDFVVRDQPDGVAHHHYDERGFLRRIETNRPRTGIIHETFDFDDAGRPTLRWRNDPWLHEEWTYHPNGVIALHSRAVGDHPVAARREYDDQGRLIRDDSTTPVTQYRYGKSGLEEVWSIGGGETSSRHRRQVFSRDAEGRVLLEWSVHDEFRLWEPGCWHHRSATRRTYTCEGDLVREETRTLLPGGGWSVDYTLDSGGDRVRAERRDAAGNITETTEYGYDCFSP